MYLITLTKKFFTEAKSLIDNIEKTNSLYPSDIQTIIRYINKRLESYEPTMKSHEKQLKESIQKIQDEICAAYIKGNKAYIEKYVNSPKLPQEVKEEAKRYLYKLACNF